MRKCRSTAGVNVQTREVNLVVLTVALGILLSSVIRVQRLASNLAVFDITDPFRVRPEYSRIRPEEVNNGHKVANNGTK